MAEISISAFASDILHIEKGMHMLDNLPVSSLHIDIMDGHFVPMYGFNPLWIRRIQEIQPLKQDFHFMAYVTEKMLIDYLRLGPDMITLHVETKKSWDNRYLLKFIKNHGVKAGVAVAPGTAVDSLREYFPIVDDILIMSAEPGQEHALFIENTFSRIKKIRELIKEEGVSVTLSVDGGLDEKSAVRAIKSGADRVVIGRAFFCAGDRRKMLEEILQAYSI